METSDDQARKNWHQHCHDALDLMRDDPAAGKRIGAAMIDEAGRIGALPDGGELVLAFGEYYLGSHDDAATAFERLAPRFDATGDNSGVILALFGTLIIWRAHGRTADSYRFGHEQLLPKLGMDPSREALLVFNAMGIVAQENGHTEEALRHFYAALTNARALGLTNRVAQIMANIGEVFYVTGNAEDAESMLTEARRLASGSSERWLAPFVSTLLALSKLALDKYEEAYQAIAGYVHEMESGIVAEVSHRAFCLSVAAYTLAMRDDLEQADALSELAMGLLDKFEEKQLKPYSWWVCGYLHRRHGRIPEAIVALNRAVEDVEDLGYSTMLFRAIKELAEIRAQQGDWKAAYDEQQRYHSLLLRSQDRAIRVRLQTLHIKNELKQAEFARHHAEEAMAERTKFEESLRQSLEERNTILENSLVGIIFLKPDGRVHWANAAMFNIFNVQRESPIGRSLEPFYPTREEYLKTGAAVSQAVRSGKFYEAELRMVRDDGSSFWAYLSGRAISHTDLSRGTVWVLMDITERKELESALAKSEEHYRQVVNNVTEGILVVKAGFIVFANPRVEQITGYPIGELRAVPFLTAIHPDDQALVVDHHVRRLRGEEVEQHYSFRVINRMTKQHLWVELSAVMIEWEGEPATLSFITDITQRKELENSLKLSLAERVRLQTLQIQGELNEAELARRNAEETTKAKSMFLANMSHEIRTPMNAIIGMAHLALRTELTSKQRDYVENIHSAGLSLLGIINDILDFSKVEAGKLDIEKIEFDLDEVLSHVSTVTSGKAHDKGLEYLFQTPPDVPRKLIGDPLRLGQVLINLVNNAIKFTDNGEVYVACRLREISSEGIQLEFLVRDTGIGMTTEQAGRLFSAFSQADESTTRKYGGTGLGLSISKAMVELMDGEIWLESKVQVGTAIHFTARFGLSAAQQQRDVMPQSINGMRVLVVDDNAVAREILTECLRTMPVDIEEAVDGREALMAIRACDARRPFSIVITDLRMPEMDGVELITEVKRGGALQSPPRMVLVSAHGRDDVRYREGSALADAFLMKPLNASVLVDTVVNLFSPKVSSGPVRSHSPMPHFHELTLLLVEDNAINQQIATELLESAGVTVETASNGRIALQMLQAAPTRYQFVFMDIQMPEMDGHECARLVRADGRFQSLPIVAMTAHAMVEERGRCLASGMNDHLSKPIDANELYQMVERWCPNYIATGRVDNSGANELALDRESQDDVDLVIDGFDVADGLMRTLNNRPFYLQLLARFRDDQLDAAAKIRDALKLEGAAGRLQAERLAHTLKGVAGQVGATAMHGLAGQLESDIHSGAELDVILPLVERIDRMMQSLRNSLEKVLPDPLMAEESPRSAIVEVNHEATRLLIQRIATLLRDYDSEAMDLLAESGKALEGALTADVHRQIARAAHQFDFDTALSVLEVGAKAAGYHIT